MHMGHGNQMTRRFKRVWHRPQGFTLIEVTVTLTITGFILLIVFGAFRLGLSAWEKGESTKNEYQKIRILSELISRQIKSVVPYKIKTQKAEGDYLGFEGKTQSLKFVSAFSIKAKNPEGFVYAVYQFRKEGREGSRFVLYEQRVLNKDFFEEEPREELAVSLLEGVSDVSFEYYQKEDTLKNRTERWVKEWSAKEEKELPKALKVIITYEQGGNEKMEIPLELLIPMPAYQFEDAIGGQFRPLQRFQSTGR
jgi:prepilin-type N-terminal cleavage/methylation domain-containing protein